jgi:hypothetical protein
MGVLLFKEPSLWQEDDGVVARRLGWPQESQTTTQSSFRLYPSEQKPVNILGARAYSCVLYATRGRPTEVSIVFVNEGDYAWTQNYLATAKKLRPDDTPDLPVFPTNSAPDLAPELTTGPADDLEMLRAMNQDDLARVGQDVRDAFAKALKQDTQTLTDGLTKLFGDPQHTGFGGGAETRERVLRWDWQGHAFLLSSPKDAYVTLRIVPIDFADNYGKGDVIDRDELKTELAQRVKQSDSGDVVVGDIPMVDQGPKGYCVPATWERYLRYLGIPADMYVLANAAGTSQLGTGLDAMVVNFDSLVTLYHRRIDGSTGDLDLKTIARSIDAGLPIMWACSIHLPFEKAISSRKKERDAVTDWNAWAAKLQEQDKTEIPAEITGSPIARTNEVAISDSWSKAYAIRWLTLDEANAINAGHTYVIEP